VDGDGLGQVLESEEEEFTAIQAIHAQLDNNHDGSVDLVESSGVIIFIAPH